MASWFPFPSDLLSKMYALIIVTLQAVFGPRINILSQSKKLLLRHLSTLLLPVSFSSNRLQPPSVYCLPLG